ncbi:MAG TPA: OPT/YSL family transporter, partial [Phycisphaerae bacterium]|nr:OPT/YSL family transporter [Phycisphaerae bacterium]
QFVVGMVLPFFAMLGSFIGMVLIMVANPLLYRFGVLRSWTHGEDTIKTLFKNNIDFYFSFSIGIALAVALAGIWQVVRNLRARAREKRARSEDQLVVKDEDRSLIPPGRGDIRPPLIIGVYLFTSSIYILLSGLLIKWHPGVMLVLLFFAFLYTPIISYVTARLEGLAGQVVEIPMIREAAFLLSGYSGDVTVWFLPVPIADYGRGTVFYKQAELSGTRFWSLWKAEILLVPIVILSSIMFAQFIWSLGEIPGPEYPYAEKMWELNAANRCIILSSTLGLFSQFQETFRWEYLACGGVLGLVLFSVLYSLHLPIMLVYGVVRGLNQTMPHVVLPQFIGALIGRFYFRRKMGLIWRQYVPVVSAGFGCGMGLVTVLAVGVNFLAKAVIKIPF